MFRSLVKLERESKTTTTCKAASFSFLWSRADQSDAHVLQLLHDETVDHVRHVGWDFARCETELAVQQLVDVTQGVGKSVVELSAGGGRIGVIRQLVLQAFFFLELEQENTLIRERKYNKAQGSLILIKKKMS